MPLERLDDGRRSPAPAAAGAFEVVSRLTVPDYRPVPIGLLTRGKIREDDLPEILYEVRNQAEDLQRLLIGE